MARRKTVRYRPEDNETDLIIARSLSAQSTYFVIDDLKMVGLAI